MSRYAPFSVCLFLAAIASESHSGTPALLSIEVNGKNHIGRVEALDKMVCWVASRDGSLTKLNVPDVGRVKKVADKFAPLTTAQMRTELRKDLPAGMEVATTANYVVAAKSQSAREYAKLFDSVYRNIRNYFVRRGFKLKARQFALVAIVFPDRKQFEARCKQDRVPPLPTLRGYYLRTTNQIVLYDRGSEVLSAKKRLLSQGKGLPDEVYGAIGNDRGTVETMIHEATHQAAFNLGLHSRIGDNPKWIVEGLATTFESDGIRLGGRGDASSRANRGRLLWFRDYIDNRRKKNSLEAFIANDDPFAKRPLDAYSEGWALTFFLMETRAADYGKFLRRVSARDPLQTYTSEARVADFKAAFGKDLKWLEVQMLRFIKKLK